MSDEPEVRVFDSVSAAVANSAQPVAPPYADVTPGTLADAQPDAPEEVTAPAPPAAKAAPNAPKPVGRKGQNVRAQAGAAEGTGAAKGPGE